MDSKRNRWVSLKTDLTPLGWKSETKDVQEGLRSPNNACVVIPEDVNDDARRADLIVGLERHVERLKRDQPKGFLLRGWSRAILDDFEQLLKSLKQGDDVVADTRGAER